MLREGVDQSRIKKDKIEQSTCLQLGDLEPNGFKQETTDRVSLNEQEPATIR